MIKDSSFASALERVSEDHGLFPDYDGCDLFFAALVQKQEDVLGYLTKEDQEKIEKYFENVE